MATVGRFFQDPGSHYFLFGPRGTGKSTWLRAAYPDALWVDLLEPEAQRRYAARPERLRELVAGSPEREVCVVDEVQKVPALLDVVHGLIEARPGPRFVLTGSSARKLRRGGVDLLAGRALLRALRPFMAAELGVRFDLDQALTQGLVPLVWDADRPREALAAYVALYLQQEVQAEGLVRRIGDFARFLEAISFSHAAALNLAAVSRESEVSRKTVEGYVEILEDLLLAFRLPVFRRRAQRLVTAHPKFYWFDAGVYAALRPTGPLDRPAEIAGAALEGLVAQHLRAWIDYSGADLGLSFWRTKGGSEVDFVLYGGDGFHAIEVKHTATVRPADLRSLKAFGSDYPEATLRLLYRGGETLEIDGIRCVPCEKFLAELRPLPGAKDPLRVHPELSRIEFRADPAAPLDPEDWPGGDQRS
jgi:predicted AAA+ superfamily ATPase